MLVPKKNNYTEHKFLYSPFVLTTLGPYEENLIFLYLTLCGKKEPYNGTILNQMKRIGQLILNKRKFSYQATANKLYKICLKIDLTILRIIIR